MSDIFLKGVSGGKKLDVLNTDVKSPLFMVAAVPIFQLYELHILQFS